MLLSRAALQDKRLPASLLSRACSAGPLATLCLHLLRTTGHQQPSGATQTACKAGLACCLSYMQLERLAGVTPPCVPLHAPPQLG